jgi:putative ABC transport system permease protein
MAGVMLVVITSAITTGFRTNVTNILTDTQLSHTQIHKAGYMANVSNIPLNIFLNKNEMAEVENILKGEKAVEVYSPRINFSSIISVGETTSNVRITGVNPEQESKTCPGQVDQMQGIKDKAKFLTPGEIIVPDIIAKGLSINIGDEVILITTNRSGSMNGITLKLAGIIVSTEAGERGRPALMHINDAMSLLRMDEAEISEVAIRVKNGTNKHALNAFIKNVKTKLSAAYEIHPWEKLTPFASILAIINVINVVVKIILITIVLISILNIMVMSVYERINEIGTIAAIGTTPNKIMKLFVTEGALMGLLSTVMGIIFGIIAVLIINAAQIRFQAGPFFLIVNGELKVSEILLTAVIVMVISIFASLQPAAKAAKLDPVDALGHV